MKRRLLVALSIAAVSVFIAVQSMPLQGQTQSQSTIGANTPDLVVTAYNGGPPIPYTVPRTPWGDPDLQGAWSSDDAQFGGGGGGRGGRGGGGAARGAGGAPANAQAGAARGAAAPATPAGPPPLYLTPEQFEQRKKDIAAGVARAEGNEVSSTFRNDFPRRAFAQTRAIVDPPDGRQPAFTPEAEKRRATRDQGTFGNGPFNSPEDFTLYDRCITRGIWGSVMRVIYGNGNRIVQAPGMVAISYEMIHDTRVFYTDGRPHIGNAIRQYLGDSRARWDGDTLVVETTNLTDKTSIGANGNGLRHSDKMRIVEKLKRVAPDVIQYQITIDDPVTYVRPFTASIPLTPLDGGALLPYDCHEGNHAVLQGLGAERAEDAAIAADLAKGIKRERRGAQETGTGGGRGRGAGAGGRGGAPPDPTAAPPEQ
ncbi:MAG TPA: hypothetical protein VFV95_15575 [Vicinamibacterales bacterium]|nr:hypothetical protein [Vicinamibacterales bacterium]